MGQMARNGVGASLCWNHVAVSWEDGWQTRVGILL
jgi:hypothetical protein